jgi:hypothetical protein
LKIKGVTLILLNLQTYQVSSLGVFDKECFTFLEMLDTIGMDKKQQHYCIKR